MQQELAAWAKKRVDAGGSPIRLRIVKGANMEMELVEASIQNWPLAPYDNKLEVDANFKRMVDFGMEPENIRAVLLGIGSHNLFELAYALKVAERNNVTSSFCFEMLEGMADHVRRAIQETTGDMLLYAPVASKSQFINAIAYLIRRLDENTAEENYLRYSFNLKTDSPAWKFLVDQFISAYHYREKAGVQPKRQQNRSAEKFEEYTGTFHTGEFTNEPDTDWSLEGNRIWAEGIRDKWKTSPGDAPMEIPLAVAGKDVFRKRDAIPLMDLSQIRDQILAARCAMGNEKDVEKAVKTAKADPDGWRSMSYRDRHEVLSRVALEIRRSRADLIGAAAATTGKVFTEADVEVSEAVDFTEFYPFSARHFDRMENLQCRGKGVGLVISPWNFPIAIPCGGIAASLSAGNTVIFKPASAASLVAWVLCQCFWKAGVSKKTLQFLPCRGSTVGSTLALHPDIDCVILTGGTDTGLALLKEKPDMYLAAETGGKNATIVTAMSDRDQAIKNVIHSAFGNCGQKCSATSLLILEKEVYEDEGFKRQLVDAASSMHVGSAWDFKSKIGPLIQPPVDPLKTALTKLEPEESWALRPENRDENPYLWSPGIKWDVQFRSSTHMTEFFGPLLGVMCADNLDEALAFVNDTGYGLTSGIETLDDREHQKWKETVRAGNLYINRGTTGAVVLRQPFGGMGKSALGAGIKVGFFNYVSQFMDFKETGLPPTDPISRERDILRLANEWKRKAQWDEFGEQSRDVLKAACAIQSYLYAQEQEFSQEKDYFHLRGQDNIIKYIPVGKVLVRIHPDDTLFEILARIAAVRISGCTLFLSAPENLENAAVKFLKTHEGRALRREIKIMRESDEGVVKKIGEMDRIRYAAPDRVPTAVFFEAARTGYFIARDPVLMEGRLELLQYHREQSICNNYHRYGNLGERSYFEKDANA
jgi:RHH-type proline utilization regulon transcriptional repressor/proline dehydrogenase/delta 1-pyrroline-5-carboxylate dehydrogenase